MDAGQNDNSPNGIDPDAEESVLTLPEDLTPVTKVVLNKIYDAYLNSLHDSINVANMAFREIVDEAFQKFTVDISLFAVRQKTDMRRFIESLLHEPQARVAGEHIQEPSSLPAAESSRISAAMRSECCPHSNPQPNETATAAYDTPLPRWDVSQPMHDVAHEAREVDADQTVYRSLPLPACPHQRLRRPQSFPSRKTR